MRQMKKRKSDEDEDINEKKRRRNGSEAIKYLLQKCEKEMVLLKKEIEFKVIEGTSGQFGQMIQMMQQQQDRQQQQSQSLQILMAQQNKAFMSLIEKMVSKNE